VIAVVLNALCDDWCNRAGETPPMTPTMAGHVLSFNDNSFSLSQHHARQAEFGCAVSWVMSHAYGASCDGIRQRWH